MALFRTYLKKKPKAGSISGIMKAGQKVKLEFVNIPNHTPILTVHISTTTKNIKTPKGTPHQFSDPR